MIEVSGLRKAFGGREVLGGVDLAVERGSVVALLGPNGAGKSTTVRILTTLLAPDAGTVRVGGFDVVRQAREVRRLIGVTGQQTAVDRMLTGYENLVMMGRLFRLGTAAARRRADELLARFDLTGAAGRPVKTYSGGMERRLDLAISMITAPPVLFLDEPTTGLDPRSRAGVWDTVRDLLAGGVTVLLTTQYLEEADELAGRVAVIDGGRVVAEGTPASLKQRIGSERLDLTFATREALEVARLALGGTPAGEGLALSVPVDGARDVREVLDRLHQAEAEIADLALTRPTLDDVFLSLTGEPAIGALR
ncbi:ATP-binding cassette domain-containing protein [Amycolatopsis thermalba]|uniref:ATP-binding cassette domain-containing protein n=1 Tax=Amycolatopsis thermalba TaxID=944492 RepID=A0ABY4NTP4_9PSEU|nr:MULTISPECIES: ATP-binding cassette domain-containing protein [Amycolatopsis]OXM66110.1 ABC transporter [Amycolatopsis sp. KNN50.9b]UQS23436.1 ATP-binding cassette domain-containing protein [Amycolatopsis thermalba]